MHCLVIFLSYPVVSFWCYFYIYFLQMSLEGPSHFFFFFFFSPGCGQVLRASRGQILLEGYPLNARCEWTIHVQAGFNLELRWVLLTFSQHWLQVDTGTCGTTALSPGLACDGQAVDKSVLCFQFQFRTDGCWGALGTCLFRGIFKTLTAKHPVFSEDCTKLD